MLSNGVATARLDTARGALLSLSHGSHVVSVAHDAWAVSVNMSLPASNLSLSLSSATCHRAPSHDSIQSAEASFTWECATGHAPPHRLPLSFHVVVQYSLPPNATFLSKVAHVRSSDPWSASGGTFTVSAVAPFGHALTLSAGTAASTSYTQPNPYAKGLSIATFVRWGTSGAFVSLANPWARYGVGVAPTYTPRYTHRASTLHGEAYATDAAVLGLTWLSQYSLNGVNTGEASAFRECVSSHLLDDAARLSAPTVKVNVAWDESDYQIDVGSAAGRAEYDRILRRNAQINVTHVVYAPRNTKVSSRFNSTDGWGWEGSLWFGMGERIRQGSWYPGVDALPPSVSEMLERARQLNVKLLAYVYPCLLFEAHPEAWVRGSLDLSSPGVAEWLAQLLCDFMEATGAGGFAFDHDIFAPEGGGMQPTGYAQWRGWMSVLSRLRARFPDIVIDHRQTAHAWGPWYHLAGSYAEPLAGDENPETYGVLIPSLSADHVAADQLRQVNHVYASQQLIPMRRMPGFVFHQTERTADNGTNPCFGNEKRCFDNNTRDFDLLGYQYSLLSTLATAGLNLVMCMLPARDETEFKLFPAADLAWISSWIRWAEAHAHVLAHTAPIATLPPPGLGSVDGTSAVSGDAGLVFLFNPSMMPLNATLHLDESLGMPNASSSSSTPWAAIEIYPRSRVALGVWSHREVVTVLVPAASAVVIELQRGAQHPPLLGLPGKGFVTHGERIEWVGAQGVGGQVVTAVKAVDDEVVSSAAVNGIECTDGRPPSLPLRGAATLDVRFAGGPPVLNAAPIGLPPTNNTGGAFDFAFAIPAGVLSQLADRQKKYPVPWYAAERNATWLVPSRLLASIYIAKPSDSWNINASIGDVALPVYRSYNSRGLVRPRCFLGYYLDLSEAHVAPDAMHKLRLQLPTLPPGAFTGVFLQNVETEYVSVVESCRLV